MLDFCRTSRVKCSHSLIRDGNEMLSMNMSLIWFLCIELFLMFETHSKLCSTWCQYYLMFMSFPIFLFVFWFMFRHTILLTLNFYSILLSFVPNAILAKSLLLPSLWYKVVFYHPLDVIILLQFFYKRERERNNLCLLFAW